MAARLGVWPEGRVARPLCSGPAMLAMLGISLLAGCASCPPQTQVVQERGAKPRLDEALALAQRVLARSEPDFAAGTSLQPVYDDVYAINATNLAWNWEQAWMLCVAYEDDSGELQRRGVAMRVDGAGRPFHVSSVNWRDYSGASC
mgnify:CR=1 FL=1